MGVPFEALLPYGIMVSCLLRRYRCWSLQDQKHSERRQEAQALRGPVGQTDDGPRPPPHRIPAWTGRSAYRAGWFRAQQWLEGREARHVNISKDIQRRTMARCARTFFL